MLKKIVISTGMTAWLGLAAVGCDAADVEDEARLLDATGLCIVASDHDTARIELRDAEIAALVSAPPGGAPSIYVDVEGVRIELVDDGLGPDRVANDGTFTAEIAAADAPSDEHCRSGTEAEDEDEAEAQPQPEPGAHQPGQDPHALHVDLDPQAVPPDGGYCHDWKYAWSGAVQVWYCTCFAWDVWSC